MLDYIYKKEHEMLRDELNNLKKCQVTFFTTTVTATGLILTVAAKISPIDVPALGFLLPLTILIPSCLIFFDKAMSISRIVGYYRILEKFLLQGKKCEYDFIGWENALKMFRDYKPNDYCNKKLKSGPGGYLKLIYISYFGLSVFCIFLYLNSKYPNFHLNFNYLQIIFSDYIFLIIFLAFLISFLYNLKILIDLIGGKHSYDCNEKLWTELFKKNTKHD